MPADMDFNTFSDQNWREFLMRTEKSLVPPTREKWEQKEKC